MDMDSATAQVLGTSADIGLHDLVGKRRAFVNLPERFLEDPDLVPLPPGQLVLEVLETVELTPARIAGLQTFRERGYMLALDDVIDGSVYESVLPLMHIVKLDIPYLPVNRWASEIDRLKARGCLVLAEKVESEDEFRRLHELGCDYFQGYFFARPTVLSGRRLAANKLSLLRLLAQINEPTTEIDELAKLVGSDLALSLRAMNIVNSAAYGLNRRLDSVREAVVYLGREKTRNLVALLLMARVDDKPTELMTMALVRGKFCELLAEEAGLENPGAYFTAGLFSVLDALMDAPMPEVLSRLPISDDLRDALVCGAGEKGRLLRAALAIERGSPDARDVEAFSGSRIATLHRVATQWADSTVAELSVP